VDYPALKKAVLLQYWKHRPFQVAVEDTTHGRPLVQEFQRMAGAPPVAAYPVVGNKVTRLEAVTGWFAGGFVVLPGRLPDEEPPWLERWTREHLSFPFAEHDDQVDTTSLALSRLTLRDPEPIVIGKVKV
jgi:predicted phage terminase large subunit-like protein